MKNNERNFNLDIFSIDQEDSHLFKQKLINCSEHIVSKRYIMKGLNDLNYHFLTEFNEFSIVVGEFESILFKTQDGEYVPATISEVKQNPSYYNIIVPLPHRIFERNDYQCNVKLTMNLKDDSENRNFEYILNMRSGYFIGKFISDKLLKEESFNNDFVQLIFDNPEILYSTNKNYVYGVLTGLKYENIDIKKICCAYLGIKFGLNENHDDIIYDKNELDYIMHGVEIIDYRTINCLDIYFKEITNENDGKDILYDFSTENHIHTNYAFPFTPILKNSDGDILTIMAVSTRQGVNDALKFSPENKEYFRSLNDGNIKNYIADDAVLGLYNATK